MKTVIIGIPSGDTVHADFAMSLVMLATYSISKGIKIVITNHRGSIIEKSRCVLVDVAKKYEVDYLLMIDSDMKFPNDLLERMLAHDKDVVCCDHLKRREPHDQCIIAEDGEKINYATNKKDLVKIIGASTATILIKMNVFDKIEKPYFCVPYMKEKEEFLGEDYYFSRKAGHFGVEFWCDTKLSQEIVHIGTKGYQIGGK